MKQHRLGKTGPMVSRIGLGCMGMSMGYGTRDDDQSIAAIHRAIELGVTLIDTADMYGWGHNETLIAKAIKEKRDKVVLATKLGFRLRGDNFVGEGGFYLDGSPAYIKQACDESLQRLGVDYIDLYYLHRIDPKTPIEESIGAMADLVKAGKIRHIGISEVKPATIRRAANVHPICAVQTEYSLWHRDPENEIIPTCRELGIGFVAYCPLGRGFLTATVHDIDVLPQEDFRKILPRYQGEDFAANQQLLVQLKELAAQKQLTPAQLSIAWVLAQGEDIVPIPGTKKVRYVEENVKAVDVNLSVDDLEHLEIHFPMGAAKGKKYPDQFELEA
jgi:aryl-alcohol dehydrogenase-like predicted oxidoreductase